MKNTPRINGTVTIKDVAREAGVSAMTVSNVLNGRGRVSLNTAARIREVVERLGYRPSVAARRLRLSRQWTIGMLIVVEDQDFLSDPFITAQVTGITNYLTRKRYSLIIRGIRPSDFSTASLFQDIEADGMVAILSGPDTQRNWCMKQLAKLHMPIALLQEQTVPLRQPDCIILRQDDFGGGRAVARHLLASGCRRFWMLMPETEWPAMKARMSGVQAELDESGCTELAVISCGNESFDVAFAATRLALEQRVPPDAIIGGNDQLAIAGMKACQDNGLRVPGDVQVSGFNGFEFCRYADPVLTTVQSAAHLLGERAGEELIKRLHSGKFCSQEIVLPIALQPGRSTEAAP